MWDHWRIFAFWSHQLSISWHQHVLSLSGKAHLSSSYPPSSTVHVSSPEGHSEEDEAFAFWDNWVECWILGWGLLKDVGFSLMTPGCPCLCVLHILTPSEKKKRDADWSQRQLNRMRSYIHSAPILQSLIVWGFAPTLPEVSRNLSDIQVHILHLIPTLLEGVGGRCPWIHLITLLISSPKI